MPPHNDPEEYVYNADGIITGLTAYGVEAKKAREDAALAGRFLAEEDVGWEVAWNRFFRDQCRFRSLLCWVVIYVIIRQTHLLSEAAPHGPIHLLGLLLVGLTITSPTARTAAVSCLVFLVVCGLALALMLGGLGLVFGFPRPAPPPAPHRATLSAAKHPPRHGAHPPKVRHAP